VIQNWLAILTITGLLLTGTYHLIRIVIKIYAILDQIKQSALASDQVLEDRLDHLRSEVTGLQRDVRDIRGVIRKFIPHSFRRATDEADRQEDGYSE
jgi:hypothetical protein